MHRLNIWNVIEGPLEARCSTDAPGLLICTFEAMSLPYVRPWRLPDVNCKPVHQQL